MNTLTSSSMRAMVILAALFFFTAFSNVRAADLEEGFKTPPDSAKPLTWWHWLDGNITSNGITADLEAMKRAGLGGAYLFNAGVGMPHGPVRFMQPEWLAMMDYTLQETKRLGLKFGIHNCDGFSQAGGPWITPETSMKQLTWTVQEVEGPATVDLQLEQPEVKENFYRDIAVVAFPVPQGRVLSGRGTDTTISGSVANSMLAKLGDGNPDTQAVFPVAPNGNRIDFVFPTQRTVRSLVICNTSPIKWEEDFPIMMEVSQDGSSFRRVGAFTASWDFYDGGKMTAACEDATGTVFRLTFNNPWPLHIGEIELSETARVHFGEAKAAWMRCRGHGAERTRKDAFPGPSRNRYLPPELTVVRSAVKNISEKMDSAGRLKWDMPQGRWRIARVGYTSNGRHNAPATPEGRGLECDKLDAGVVRAHLEAFVGKMTSRDADHKTLVAMEVDSWECGIQNWTAGFEKRFQKQTGFDLLQFMPALLEGWIVDNADVTERALWDWRRFLSDQFNEHYFSVVSAVAREKGLTYVGESTGRQQYLYDTAWMRNSAVPMGEMWNGTEPGQGVRVDNKVASSLAHTTGKSIVATEAYTSGGEHAGWDNHPFTMKPLGDKAFCAGVNQFVFHTFAHQPYQAVGPGFTFASWGLNFNRANTWWESVHAWTDYLTRCNYLLREGKSVCDVLFYVGEDVPNRIAWREELNPSLPNGYDFDGCDTRAIMEARVKDGRIVLPGGAEYRILLLPNLTTMRPALLKQIKTLVEAGAIALGSRPQQSPSLGDLGAGDESVRKIAGELWDGRSGQVFSGISFEELFRRTGLAPDFAYKTAASDGEVLYIHRSAGNAEVYFVSNQKNRTEDVTASFRAGRRAPELWDPATGETRPLPDFQRDGDSVRVPLRLDPFGSAFVVFRGDRKPSGGKNWTEWQTLQTLTNTWRVCFPPNLGAPESAVFDKLVSFTERPEPGIRFFSGTATYETEVDIPAGQLDAKRALTLDLGDVQVMAEVVLNGKNLGVLWKPPYIVRVDGAAKEGANHLVVRVTNLWRNRMIGDASLPDNDIDWKKPGGRNAYPVTWPDWLVQGHPRPGGRISFCTRKDVYKKSDILLPSGLLGPVRLGCTGLSTVTNI